MSLKSERVLMPKRLRLPIATALLFDVLQGLDRSHGRRGAVVGGEHRPLPELMRQAAADGSL
jgi:hypothetical protein